MPLTRAFKSGNSQAVRIPAELAYEDMNVDLTITRHGDVIVIAPARATMKEVIAKLARDAEAAERRSPRADRDAGSRAGLSALAYLIDTNIAIHARDGFEPVLDETRASMRARCCFRR